MSHPCGVACPALHEAGPDWRAPYPGKWGAAGKGAILSPVRQHMFMFVGNLVLTHS